MSSKGLLVNVVPGSAFFDCKSTIYIIDAIIMRRMAVVIDVPIFISDTIQKDIDEKVQEYVTNQLKPLTAEGTCEIGADCTEDEAKSCKCSLLILLCLINLAMTFVYGIDS